MSLRPHRLLSTSIFLGANISWARNEAASNSVDSRTSRIHPKPDDEQRLGKAIKILIYEGKSLYNSMRIKIA